MRFDPEAVVHGLYAAWTMQDVETTLAYCHDDIRYRVVTTSGEPALAADTVGKAAVGSYLSAVCAAWEFIEVVPGPFTVDGNILREQTRFRAIHRPSGLPLDGRRRHVWVVEDGRVRSCTEYQDIGALAAFLRMAEARCRSMAGAVVLPVIGGAISIGSLHGLL